MIKEYKKKSDNKAYYMYTCYLGTDPITGKQVFATKRGFCLFRALKPTYTQHQVRL
ncbi:Arm DNA-binding domain-containing protein [Globicatella sanguinis]|uniref:Arm DNA-binding domain-containing protein n=1 Tax=Globicatella sanguinis TaxID=13076 RepID=UPI003D6D74D4